MSTMIEREKIAKAIEEAGEGWLLSFWGERDRDRLLEGSGRQIAEFMDEYERRFGERPDPFALLHTDPGQGRAFFQNDTFMVSLEMKILIWRILIGCDIVAVSFQYELLRKPSFTVTLRTPDGKDERYAGGGLFDFKVLRHFAASSIDGGLVLQGYYPAKRK